MAHKQGVTLPFGWDTLITLLGFIAIGVWGYATFVDKVEDLEEKMQIAQDQIAELITKHEETADKRFQDMEEQVNWYQKEFNINPFRKKKK